MRDEDSRTSRSKTRLGRTWKCKGDGLAQGPLSSPLYRARYLLEIHQKTDILLGNTTPPYRSHLQLASMTVTLLPQGPIDSLDAAAVEAKYEAERQIQLRAHETVSDIEITVDDGWTDLAQDPWAGFPDPAGETPHLLTQRSHLLSQHRHRVLIVGAGFGGLLFAVRLLQTGQFKASDIVIADTAAGFGGTWYWNRYPGLMCDTESYIYMPLLEETGYMPRDKYASGSEIRQHAERIARYWGLETRAMFRTSVRDLAWDEDKKIWNVAGRLLGDVTDTEQFRMAADIVLLASGSFASPRVPNYPDIAKYKGKLFHTARWDYQFTGGSLENPKLTGLADKRVGIIGTGASAVQIIPHLARYSRSLIVFQRTPAAVDARDNRPTDPVWWKEEMASQGAGWQQRRQKNFNAFTCNETPLPGNNCVGDGWTRMPSFSLLIGGPQNLAPDYIDQMRAVDLVRQAQIRERAHALVQDPVAADLLTPWYPGWCKRPCFHDDYLSALNKENVRLVDLRHGGLSHFTPSGVVANGEEYELDLIVLSTGYTVPVTRASPGSRGNISITGRHGMTMEAKWANGLATLHGVMTRDLPNLFFAGTSQAGACVNLTYSVDQNATHVAYILGKAFERRPPNCDKVVLQPTHEGEEQWAGEVLARAAAFRGIAGCTPGYLNGYGKSLDSLSPEQQVNMARLAAWGEGIASYVNRLEEWREKGELEGVEMKFLN
jgi:cation diffusion facilitator CzcD-associated flavoprotein CzcO